MEGKFEHTFMTREPRVESLAADKTTSSQSHKMKW